MNISVSEKYKILQLDNPPDYPKDDLDQSVNNGVRVLQIGLALHYIKIENFDFAETIVADVLDDLAYFDNQTYLNLMEGLYNRIKFSGPTFWEDTDRGNTNIYYSPDSDKIDDFKKIMDDNFYNIVHFLNHCITKMSDSSSVVFFSSIAAVRGFKNHTAISSAKSALIGLSNSLAADYAPKIRFNTISPSLSFSKMSNFMVSNEKVAEGIGKLHPMSRLGTGDDIGNLASFLLSLIHI